MRQQQQGFLARLFRACACGSTQLDDDGYGGARAAAALGKGNAAADITSSRNFVADISQKEEAAAAGRGSAAGATDTASLSSGIPAAYEPSRHAGGDNNSHRRSTAEATVTDTPSTSYPVSYADEWDALGACMTTAAEMEACVDAVLEGSIKSAQHMFCRYDMDLDMRLGPRDFYDLMLELNLALPYADYQRMVDNTFVYADRDRDGLLAIEDFIPLYKHLSRARRAFRRQDHHCNGQIDRYDFYQVLRELELDGGQQGLQALADAAFGVADAAGRGIVNFGQVLVWYSSYLAASSRAASPQPRPQQLQQ